MGRTLSPTMISILAASAREIDYTLDLTLPDATVFKFATSPLTISGRGTYTNDLESVNQIGQSLEAVTDKVGFALQNKDLVLGQHVSNNLAKWSKAEAVIGRYYRDKDGLGLSEWIEMFRGIVQQPKSTDLQVTTDIIADTVAPGEIVCITTLGLPCPNIFKDPKTCAYTGVLATCDHNLKSTGGCDGRANSQHYRGMEHRYSPDGVVPGSGGNTGSSGGSGGGGTGGGGGGCPRLDQWLRVEGPDGQPMPLRVKEFTKEHRLWNPITRTFHDTHEAHIIRNVPIFFVKAWNLAQSYSSFSHLILWYREHVTGVRVDSFLPGDRVLTEIRDELRDSMAVTAEDTCERGDVMRIEMADGHIYCVGDTPDEYIVSHNLKPANDF